MTTFRTLITWIPERKQVRIDIEIGLYSMPALSFWRDCASDIEAELLQKVISEKFHDRVLSVRRTEYENGWKDARAKRPKLPPVTCTLWLKEDHK